MTQTTDTPRRVECPSCEGAGYVGEITFAGESAIGTMLARPCAVCDGAGEVADAEAAKTRERACRACGCTYWNACPEGCYWVEEDLCSSCVERLWAGRVEAGPIERLESGDHLAWCESHPCPTCHGLGEVDIERPGQDDLAETCPVCDGSGIDPPALTIVARKRIED